MKEPNENKTPTPTPRTDWLGNVHAAIDTALTPIPTPTPTPRTDAEIIRSNLDEVACDCVSTSFARTLERELTAARQVGKAAYKIEQRLVESLRLNQAELTAALERERVLRDLLVKLRPRTLVRDRRYQGGNSMEPTELTHAIDAALATPKKGQP